MTHAHKSVIISIKECLSSLHALVHSSKLPPNIENLYFCPTSYMTMCIRAKHVGLFLIWSPETLFGGAQK